MALQKVLMIICTAGLFASSTIGPASSKERSCNVDKVRSFLDEFIDAYNSGETATLDDIFPAQEDFSGYRFSPEREDPDSSDRSTLMAYFRDRHAMGDVLTIQSLTTGERRSPDGSCGFNLTLRRQSDDSSPWADGVFSGKGGVKPTKRHVWGIRVGWSPYCMVLDCGAI